jgi:hypothetical protein
MLHTVRPVDVRKPSPAQEELIGAGQIVGEALSASEGKDIGDRAAVNVMADFLRLSDRTDYDRARYGLIGRLTCKVMQHLAEPDTRQLYVDKAAHEAAQFLLEAIAPRYFTAFFDRHTPQQKAASLTAANTGRIANRLKVAALPAVQEGLNELDLGSKVAGNLLQAANAPGYSDKPFHTRHISYRPTLLEKLPTRLWPERHMRRKVARQLTANHALWSEINISPISGSTGSPLARAVHENMFGGASQIAHKGLFEGKASFDYTQLPAELINLREEAGNDVGISRIARKASATNFRKVPPITSIGGMIGFNEHYSMVFKRPTLSTKEEAQQRAQGQYHFRENALVCPAATVVGALPVVVDMALLAQYRTYEMLCEALS